MPRVKYLSMFSGVGGFELGIQNAFGKTVGGGQENPPGDTSGDRAGLFPAQGQSTGGSDGRPSTSSPDQPDDGPLCIGYSEIDKYAVQTYEKNFKEHKNYGDATKINESDLPDFGLLVGGFPCQAFSVAGKRRGFDDTRGTLFFDIARILKHKRPRHIFLENVKGLLSHDSGKTFQTILGVLADLGYRVEWQVLNSKHFGVPQNRERIYIVGHLRGGCGRQILPIAGPDRTVTREAAIVTPHIRYGAGKRITSHTLENTVPTIRATHHKNGDNQPRVLEPAMLTETRTEEAKAIRRQHQAQGRDWSPRRGKVLKPRPDGIANTVTTGLTKEHLLLAGSRVRKLTPIETERLQGFPDNWTTGSDTQRYKQCGNAVTTKVVEAVISAMLVGCEL